MAWCILYFCMFISVCDIEHQDENPNKQIHISISESNEGNCWDQQNLVFIGDECFRPGHRIFAEIIRCLEKTAVVVAAISRNFCHSYYCKQELEEARIMDKPVILVFIEDVEENEMSDVMREIFRNFTRVKIVRQDSAYQSQPDWPHVCRSIIYLIH